MEYVLMSPAVKGVVAKRYRRQTDESIDRDTFLERIRREVARLSRAGCTPLWEEAANIAVSGKMLRPIFAYELFQTANPGGAHADPQFISDIAALELLHTSTLIHDDIIDQSNIRRGLPTLHAQHGSGVALLVGNLVRDHSLSIASPCAIKALTEASIAVNQGQLCELQSRHSQAITVSDALLISLLKAGRIFRAIVDIVAEHSFGTIPRNFRCGAEAVAVVYQALDDWLDIVDVPQATQKDSRRDAANDVPSFMLASWQLEPSGELPVMPLMDLAAHRIVVEALAKNYESIGTSRHLAELPPAHSRRILLALAGGVRKEIGKLLKNDDAFEGILDNFIDKVEHTLLSTSVDMSTHFDDIAQDFEVLRPCDKRLVSRLKIALMLRRGDNLIDLGCGTGGDLAALSRDCGISPFGVDLSDTMVEIASGRIGRDSVIRSDANCFLTETDRFFERALVKFAIHHFGDLDIFYDRLFGRLTPAGRVCVVSMLPSQVDSFELVDFFPTLRSSMMSAAVSEEDMIRFLKGSGFQSVDIQTAEIATLSWDETLVEKVSRRFISFLLNVSEQELSAGLERLREKISTTTKRRLVVVEGCVVCGMKPIS